MPQLCTSKIMHCLNIPTLPKGMQELFDSMQQNINLKHKCLSQKTTSSFLVAVCNAYLINRKPMTKIELLTVLQFCMLITVSHKDCQLK